MKRIEVSSKMSEKFKVLTEKELAQCAGLFVNVFNHEPWNEAWTTKTAIKRFELIFNTPGFVGVGLLIGNRMVGMACGSKEQWMDAEHFNLVEFCIDPTFQRNKLGSELLAALEENLSKQGCKRIYLLTMRGGIAESFYCKNGYYGSKKMIMMGKGL